MATIKKRGDSYLIRVYYQNKEYSTTFKPEASLTEKQKEKAVNKFALNYEDKIKNGSMSLPSKITLSDFCDTYLKLVKESLSPVTYKSYEETIKNYIKPALGHIKIQNLNSVHIQLFVKEISRPGAQQNSKKKNLSTASIRRTYSILRSILAKANKLGLIDSNPANGDKIELPRLKNKIPDAITKSELNNIVEALSNEPLQYRALLYLAIVSGCRRGELLGLKWSDIDFENHTIHISRSLYKISKEKIKTKEPKTGASERKIVITDNCISLLRQHKYEQNLIRFQLGERWNGDDFVFTQWDGQPMHPSTPTHWFPDFLERNNLPRHTFHSLRHTSATLLLSSGTNIKNVASRLGHTQLSTTNRYLHAVEEIDVLAAKTFDEIIKKA